MVKAKKPRTDVMVGGPRPTGRGEAELQLTGCLLPFGADGRAVLLMMPGSVYLYLPLFTSLEKLQACLKQASVSYATVKQVVVGQEFLDSIPSDIVVIQDPWFTDEGKVRFMQIQR